MAWSWRSFAVGGVAGAALVSVPVALFFVSAASREEVPVHAVRSGGREVAVRSFLLAWGVDHDRRMEDEDAFALSFVSTAPGAGPEARLVEARAAFELARPVSEQWALRKASVSAYASASSRSAFRTFTFTRGADGEWAGAETGAWSPDGVVR